MVYFYHHYELPAILRQAQQPDIPTQFFTDDQNQGPPSGPQTSSSSPSTESSAPATEAAAASATSSHAPSSGGSSSAVRDSTLTPAPPDSTSAGSNNGAESTSVTPLSNITVTLSSTSSNVPPVSVEISQQHFSLGGENNIDGGGSESITSGNNLRRRVTSTLSNSSSNSNDSSSSNELRSFTEALRSLRSNNEILSGSSSSAQSAIVGGAPAVVNPAEFSTHVSVSFSTDPITTTSTAARGSAPDVSSILGTSLSSGSSAGSATYNPITRI